MTLPRELLATFGGAKVAWRAIADRAVRGADGGGELGSSGASSWNAGSDPTWQSNKIVGKLMLMCYAGFTEIEDKNYGSKISHSRPTQASQ